MLARRMLSYRLPHTLVAIGQERCLFMAHEASESDYNFAILVAIIIWVLDGDTPHPNSSGALEMLTEYSVEQVQAWRRPWTLKEACVSSRCSIWKSARRLCKFSPG